MRKCTSQKNKHTHTKTSKQNTGCKVTYLTRKNPIGKMVNNAKCTVSFWFTFCFKSAMLSFFLCFIFFCCCFVFKLRCSNKIFLCATVSVSLISVTSNCVQILFIYRNLWPGPMGMSFAK